MKGRLLLWQQSGCGKSLRKNYVAFDTASLFLKIAVSFALNADIRTKTIRFHRKNTEMLGQF